MLLDNYTSLEHGVYNIVDFSFLGERVGIMH